MKENKQLELFENDSETTLGEQINLNNEKHSFVAKGTRYYKIDIDRVKTLEDIKAILKIFQLSVNENSDEFDFVKHLLVDGEEE